MRRDIPYRHIRPPVRIGLLEVRILHDNVRAGETPRCEAVNVALIDMDVFSGMTGMPLVSRSCSSRFTELEAGIFDG